MKKILLLLTIFAFSYGTIEAQTASTGTPATNIAQTSADISATADALSTGTYGCVFWVADNSSFVNAQTFTATPATITGTGSTALTATVTGLNPSTIYYYAIVLVTTGLGGGAYVTDGGLQTFATIASPSATTGVAFNVTQTSATIFGSGDTQGATLLTAIGYKKAGDLSYTYVSGTPSSQTDGGSFTANITGLTANTTYNFVTAFFDATPSLVVESSPASSFTTASATAPTVTTGTLGNITDNSVQINSNQVTSGGGDGTVDYGLAYGTTTAPTTLAKSNDYDGDGTKSYDGLLFAVLSPSTKYYVRAYASNNAGTGYGTTELSFYTEPSSGANFSSITGLTNDDHTTLTLNWSAGDGAGRVILAYTKDVSPTAPVDGIAVSGSSTFVGDGSVLYAGSGVTSVVVTGLAGSTTDYDFYIYEYSGFGTDINYKQSGPGFITTVGTTFPIELISFTAKNDNGNVLINWATASETDNDYFEIERSSDAENFEVIANVVGAGYSNEVLNYSIQDNAALDGTVYYRLKQTDFNGAFTYSYILPIKIGESNDLQISNIINADNSISFVYNNNDGGTTQIQLLDISGRIVKTQEVSGEGSQLVRIGMSGMSHGVYVLHITLDDQKIVKKVVF